MDVPARAPIKSLPQLAAADEDESDKRSAYRQFVGDLKKVAAAVSSLRAG
jgi:hypothetical protein